MAVQSLLASRTDIHPFHLVKRISQSVERLQSQFKHLTKNYFEIGPVLQQMTIQLLTSVYYGH